MAGAISSGYLYIYSNNGQTELAKIQRYTEGVDASVDAIVTITSAGVTCTHGGNTDAYTYNGSKTFLGVATSPNATTPNYKVGDTVTWDGSDWEENVNWYIVEEKPESIKTFDLSTLNLSAGTHTITVKAGASGYEESVESNAVSYVVAGDTVQVSGTWYFNAVPKRPTQNISQTCSFTIENGRSGTSIGVHTTGSYIVAIQIVNEGKGGYDIDYGWDEAYRTITFNGVQTVSKGFYDWLVANATRPISGTWQLYPDRTFFVDGNYVEADFISKGVSFKSIVGLIPEVIRYDGLVAYDGSWVNEKYKTITFEGTQYLSNFEYENFIRIAVFAFTIDGTTYYAKEGMTWDEWVSSEYNTGGFFMFPNGSPAVVYAAVTISGVLYFVKESAFFEYDPSTLIISGKNYTLYRPTGGGGSEQT